MTLDERTILAMHTYARPAGSKTEQQFVDRYLTPLGFKRDAYKNLVLQIGKKPCVMWSSHVDTVHAIEGLQTLHYDGRLLSLSKKAQKYSNCLGADDTAGVWLLTEMAKARIPGLYVIHHAEESGMIGSKARAKWEILSEGISACIAFDRFGFDSVITHQMSRRTASDAFAHSFAKAIGDDTFKPDPDGIYTDSEAYSDFIPECTNISVGYHHQHSRDETLHVPFLIGLRDRLIAADWDRLVIERDPLVLEYDDDYGYGGDWYAPKHRTYNLERNDMTRLIETYPHVAADLLEQLGYSVYDLEDAIDGLYGKVAAQ